MAPSRSEGNRLRAQTTTEVRDPHRTKARSSGGDRTLGHGGALCPSLDRNGVHGMQRLVNHHQQAVRG